MMSSSVPIYFKLLLKYSPTVSGQWQPVAPKLSACSPPRTMPRADSPSVLRLPCSDLLMSLSLGRSTAAQPCHLPDIDLCHNVRRTELRPPSLNRPKRVQRNLQSLLEGPLWRSARWTPVKAMALSLQRAQQRWSWCCLATMLTATIERDQQAKRTKVNIVVWNGNPVVFRGCLSHR